MRLSLLGASVALAAGLALSACSNTSGSSANMPSASSQIMGTNQGHKYVVHLAPGVRALTEECPSQYNFCFYVEPGNPGPYVTTSDGTAPLYNVGTIVKAKKGKVDKKFSNYFYPDPGDPTSQYITYKGKTPKKAGLVKFDDIYCISFTASGCANGSGSILHLGIALYP